VLLLGPGDAGKTTFLKQIKSIHTGLSLHEREKFISILRENCLNSMQIILQSERVPIPDEYKRIKDDVVSATKLSECVDKLKFLWSLPVVKDSFENRNELILQIPSTANYFFDHAERFAEDCFLPADRDIMRAKQRTTGINQVEILHNGFTVVLMDVGGQRSERRKWIDQFDKVNTVIFLAALDEYDMVLEEDFHTNRLEESLRLFKSTTNNDFFQPPCWILFLNKFDIFQVKIITRPLTQYFNFSKEENAQPEDVEWSTKYIKKLFKNNFSGTGKLYIHSTCALDTNQISVLFNDIRDQLITQELVQSGFPGL